MLPVTSASSPSIQIQETTTRVSGEDLALQRTSLANARTLLAYVRTALGFGGFSLALGKLFDDGALPYAVLSGVIAFIILLLGFWHFVVSKKAMTAKKKV